jgi:OmcA/MtrC family decaheme c-type cytochrome
MKHSMKWFGAAALVLVALSGCGGGNDGGSLGGTAPPPPPPSGQIGAALAAAAANPANDTSTNSSSAFTVLQANGVPAVTVAGAPVVNFAVFSDGQVKQGLTLSNVSLAIAKLVPGANGEIDQWQSYVYRTETPAGANNVGSGPGGTPVLASAVQATTDPKPASLANQLVYNAEGYYTYRFSTDVTDPAKTNGIVFEPNRTHRIAIQLSYVNAAGATVLVNPYIDVSFDANGRSVIVTDPSKTRVMADVSSCNGCHDRLAIHGGGRVDVQYCVMCHNPGTTDANSGNVLTMQTMVHKIHAGRLLASPQNAAIGGEQYTIWGFNASKHDYSEVGFPQDLRNCSVCHSGANPKTPQGDNWKTRTSKESCLTCHVSGTGSPFDVTHTDFALAIVGPSGKPKDIPNGSCAECHRAGTSVSPGRVHFNQNEENAANYKVTIESATFDAAARKVTVKYFVSNPTDGNKLYRLLVDAADCTRNTDGTIKDCNAAKFGNLKFYLAYQNMVGQPASVTEFSAYNNGGGTAFACAFEGPTTSGTSPSNACTKTAVNDGTNKYTVEIPLPADSATAVAQGTARVVGIGQIREPKLEVKSALDPRPLASPPASINVVAQHTYADVVLSGAANPRRQVVSNEKCNVCHGALGTTTGSNSNPKKTEAFHSGARNTVEACSLCHDQNRASSSTVMTNGMALQENYSFKRMIHGIHGNSKRTAPFTHGNPVQGPFDKAGKLLADGIFLNDYTIRGFAPIIIPAGTPVAAGATFVTLEEQINAAAKGLGYTGDPVTIDNYAAEVAYPAVGLNCNGCHVNDSWKQDRSVIGSVVVVPKVGSSSDPNPLNWLAITPQAATCSSCHDSTKAIDHMVGVGGARFGTATQAQSFQTQESCIDCHGPGRPSAVGVVHK